MNLFLLTACLFIVSASQFGQSSAAEKTRLSVYYESLCPDSKRFITSKLNPLMSSKIGKFVDLELVPYGKARTRNSNGRYQFTCQHGDDECEGNKLHSCALHHLSKEEALKFIACTMSMGRQVAGLVCAESFGIDFKTLERCQKSEEGSKLLAQNGEKTHALQPSVYYVPWIVFDGNWSADRMDMAQMDLESVVCDIVGQSTCHGQRKKRNTNVFSRRRRY